MELLDGYMVRIIIRISCLLPFLYHSTPSLGSSELRIAIDVVVVDLLLADGDGVVN